ncbi:7-carboxy-7-deazaguanine synthase QueE [Amycolatopsis mongoliensis]|uniref:7-carboxy-7-deazaguanine synthase QueE n=1 Tax=Amycolatopsis mongoliensis TaxID=715475 RepID=A0A9Y2JLY0_9PSEU|nr:7-carboxy-7-deazaguanine synthase QueE [Amycolatopsis sp. 4-36]WIY01046.1 7-carboxy-7-deazaguanine synthase QueE [Amycolatopsis sp. 4-36]
MQDEGPSAGRCASFVCLGGCNLSCGWCDTPYSWEGRRFNLRAELARTPVQQLADRALAGDPELVVISGGEPLLHQARPAWTALLVMLCAAGSRSRPQSDEQQGCRYPEHGVGGQDAHAQGCDAHQRERCEQSGAPATPITDPAEDGRAQWSRQETDGEGREAHEGPEPGVAGLEEDLAEHERRSRSVDGEVVHLQRGAPHRRGGRPKALTGNPTRRR